MSNICHFCRQTFEKIYLHVCCGYCVNACDSCFKESEQSKYMFDYNLHKKYNTFDKCEHLSEDDKDSSSKRWNWTK